MNVVTHTVKGFSVVSEAKVDVFCDSFAFYDPVDIGSLITDSSAFSKSSLYIWKLVLGSHPVEAWLGDF